MCGSNLDRVNSMVRTPNFSPSPGGLPDELLGGLSPAPFRTPNFSPSPGGLPDELLGGLSPSPIPSHDERLCALAAWSPGAVTPLASPVGPPCGYLRKISEPPVRKSRNTGPRKQAPSQHTRGPGSGARGTRVLSLRFDGSVPLAPLSCPSFMPRAIASQGQCFEASGLSAPKSS